MYGPDSRGLDRGQLAVVEVTGQALWTEDQWPPSCWPTINYCNGLYTSLSIQSQGCKYKAFLKYLSKYAEGQTLCKSQIQPQIRKSWDSMENANKKRK